jgi:flagellar basal-body rod protein FlgB
MDIDSISVIAMMNRGMRWMTRNHEVLARNVANADTPKYLALELEPTDFRREVKASMRLAGVARTDAGHLKGTGAGAVEDVSIREIDDPYEMSESGNSVSLEQQAVKLSRNAMDYQLAVTLYQKSVAMVRAAIGNR